ncbi:MAG: FISUMP domain-containing protein, partial [Sphaerochaetaceae bacterium]
MDNAFNKALSYGEFTDPRDGQKYRTIVIGYYQYEYFAENLNYGRQITGGTEQTDSTKYCYGDDPWYCKNHYGGLYRWSTAMGFPAACDSVKTGSSSACP